MQYCVYSPPLNNSQAPSLALQLISTFHQRKKKNPAIRFSCSKMSCSLGRTFTCFLNWLCFVDGEACHEVFSQEKSVRLRETLTIHIGNMISWSLRAPLNPSSPVLNPVYKILKLANKKVWEIYKYEQCWAMISPCQ